MDKIDEYMAWIIFIIFTWFGIWFAGFINNNYEVMWFSTGLITVASVYLFFYWLLVYRKRGDKIEE